MAKKKIEDKRKQYEELEKEGKFDVHVDRLEYQKVEPLDEEYNFFPKFFITKILYAIIWYFLVYLIAPIITFLLYNVRIKGRRNLKHLKGGAISISNHCLDFDSVFVAQCLAPRKVYYTTLESNMRMPIVGHIIKALGGIPICSRPSMQIAYNRAIAKVLQEGKIVHFMPEGSIWPYYEKIRPFKKGAFFYAVSNDVPIVPICINFREPRRWQKFFGIRAIMATVHIGKPIYADPDLKKKEKIEELRIRSENVMRRMHSTFKKVDKAKVKEEEQKEQDTL